MRTIFSNEEIDKLRGNPCVLSCTDRTIIYTYEFKKKSLELHRDGVSAKEIWRRAGFDISKWNKDYCKDAIKDWKQIVRKRGIEGLAKLHGGNMGGRPKIKGVTDADKIKRLELQVKYLKAENDFLAKLRARKSE
jgi:hypothetical protein